MSSNCMNVICECNNSTNYINDTPTPSGMIYLLNQHLHYLYL